MRFASILSLDWIPGAGILSRDDSPPLSECPGHCAFTDRSLGLQSQAKSSVGPRGLAPGESRRRLGPPEECAQPRMQAFLATLAVERTGSSFGLPSQAL